jgi:hypothetical protein
VLKLYKKTEHGTQYWEAWDADGEVMVHWGTMGERGQTQSIKVEAGKNPNTIIKSESKRRKAEGYKTISISKLARIVIQYKIDGMGTSSDLDKRVQVENLMNECLGWKGLGHCDGGDIGSGTINVFCFVVDAETAIPHIVEELKTNSALNGAIIAISSESGDRVAWPEDFSGKFSIL